MRGCALSCVHVGVNGEAPTVLIFHGTLRLPLHNKHGNIHNLLNTCICSTMCCLSCVGVNGEAHLQC